MKISDLLTEALLLLIFGAFIITVSFTVCGERDKPGIYEKDPVLRALFPHGKPLGQPLSRHHANIRMVRVDSYREACDWFAGMCEKTSPADSLSSSYRYQLPDDNGFFVFTRKVKPGTREVAVLRVFAESVIKKGVSEVHFVETVKTR